MHKEHGTEFVEEEFQAYFKETDLDEDGRLNWDEWYAKAFQQAMEGDYFDSDDDNFIASDNDVDEEADSDDSETEDDDADGGGRLSW